MYIHVRAHALRTQTNTGVTNTGVSCSLDVHAVRAPQSLLVIYFAAAQACLDPFEELNAEEADTTCLARRWQQPSRPLPQKTGAHHEPKIVLKSWTKGRREKRREQAERERKKEREKEKEERKRGREEGKKQENTLK